jgi:RNA polymerase sigma-70 factor (ECF subfamily)
MDDRMAWRNDLASLAARDRDLAERPVRVELSDRQLVEQVIAGDEAAFEQIFTRYRRLVAKAAMRFFTRPDEVEEIIQISFTKAYFEITKFRGDHDCSLPAWLSRITSNACLDQLRNRKRRPQDLECELSDSEAESLHRAAGDRLEDGELANRDLAEKLLSVLTPEDRAVMQMLYAEELTVAEVAETLGWSKSKVKVRAWRARHTLRGVTKKYL